MRAPGLAGDASEAPTGRNDIAQGTALGQESPPKPLPWRGKIRI